MTQMLDTSLEAYQEILPKSKRRQRKVLALLQEHSPLCNYEIAIWLRWPINAVTPRVKELREQGLVLDDGKRKGSCGRNVHYWRAKKIDTLF